jgi:mercuric ion transport protein
MEKEKLTTTGAVAAAIIASLCCIGPIAVAMIGVGSVAAFSVFWEFRLYLIGLTLILLGLAFYFTYRKREVVCEDGTCKFESAGKWSKGAVWTATLLAALAIAFPYFGSTDTAAAQSMLSRQSTKSPNAAIAILNIEGMDCKGCAKGLEATLARLDGVKKAVVEYDQGRAVIEYDSTKIKSNQLIASVDETGFTATLEEKKNTNK